MTGIIAAMSCEAELIASSMTDVKPTLTISGIAYRRGRIGGEDVCLAVCGVGKVFAAVCAQTMILEFSPDRVINTGVAGAVSPALRQLDTVVADKVVQHDMDTTPLGDLPGEISGINKVYFGTDPDMSRQLAACVNEAGGHAVSGTVATGDRFIASATDKTRLSSLFGAVAADMEGGAIAHVCYISGVPCSVLRSISDSADGNAMLDYTRFAATAADVSARAVIAFARGLNNQN